MKHNILRSFAHVFYYTGLLDWKINGGMFTKLLPQADNGCFYSLKIIYIRTSCLLQDEKEKYGKKRKNVVNIQS